MLEVRCPDEADLWPLAVGEPAALDVQQHLETCGSCRRRLDRLRAELVAMRRDGLEPPPTSRELDTVPFGNGAAVPTRMLPATIGRYRVIEVLGEGGQAMVYRAVLPGLHREVVIKVGKKRMADAEAKQRLVQEGQLLASLDHPSLARVYDLDLDDGQPFLALDYVRGVNLAQYAASRKLKPQEIASLIAQAARAVAAANDRGVLHRDLKPGNIVIDESGRPRVIDFGMAQICDAWSAAPGESRFVSGTPAFMAPEQARGEAKRMGPPSDVFALGAVLYFLLTGQPAFPAADPYDAIEQAASCNFDRTALRSKATPRRLAAICLKAMSAQPEDRFASAHEMADALERFARRPRRLRRLAAAVVVAAVVLAVVWRANRPTAASLPSQPPEFSVLAVKNGAFRQLSQASPIRNGDRLQIVGRTPRDFRVAIFLRTADAELQQLEEVDIVESENGVEVIYPRQGAVSRFTGPPGTDVLFVCGRAGAAVTREEVAACFAGHASWPALPPTSTVQFNSQRSWTTGTRALRLEAAPEKPVLDQAETLRRALAERFEFVQGVAFPHVE